MRKYLYGYFSGRLNIKETSIDKARKATIFIGSLILFIACYILIFKL
ncbi:MAG: hypothetical protein ACPGLV_17980 [Bacteroidia bacterium]